MEKTIKSEGVENELKETGCKKESVGSSNERKPCSRRRV
jgi:hypothetical protein